MSESSGPPAAAKESAASTPTAAAPERLSGGRLRGVIIVNFGASVAFTAMYSTQPILPQIGAEFRVSPAQAGLTLSAVTFALAFASLGSGRVADAIGARRMMLICAIILTLLSIAVPLAPTFWSLVALRAVQGLAVPGITVAGLAFLHNDLPAAWRGRVSGFYIAANTIGGMVGRLGVGLSVATIGWRGGLWLVAGWVALGTLLLVRARPANRRGARHVAPAAQQAAPSLAAVARKLWWAPLIGGVVFFPFLTMFSYATFRLEGSPFGLSPTFASLIYLAYVLGAVASPIAGNVSDRVGRRPTIQVSLLLVCAGLACALSSVLALFALGLALICVGSLMAHVVANASVSEGANPLGAQARATALALYTLGFYVGGGLGSFVPGLALARFGWTGVVALCALTVAGAFVASLATSARPSHTDRADPGEASAPAV